MRVSDSSAMLRCLPPYFGAAALFPRASTLCHNLPRCWRSDFSSFARAFRSRRLRDKLNRDMPDCFYDNTACLRQSGQSCMSQAIQIHRRRSRQDYSCAIIASSLSSRGFQFACQSKWRTRPCAVAWVGRAAAFCWWPWSDAPSSLAAPRKSYRAPSRRRPPNLRTASARPTLR